MPTDFVRITSAQVDSLSPLRTVFFFPVGPLEDHGPHLPMGLDVLEADTLCRLAAEKLEKDLPGWTGVIMPWAALGLESNTSKPAITVRPHVLRDYLVDSCRSLMRSGFCHFVCFSGHLGPRQLTAIEDAGKIISRRSILRILRTRTAGIPTLVSASSAAVPPSETWRSPLWPDPMEHGGRRDTSVGLALGVTSGFEGLADQARPRGFWSRFTDRVFNRVRGYWGFPKQASAPLGSQTLVGTVDELFPKMRAVWEGANPNNLFRSWYSILPPNKSFAKSWLLTLMLLMLLLVWWYAFFEAISVN